MNTSHLYRHITIPDAFLTTTQLSDHSLTFGGEIRIGDLTGNGTPDLLVYRSDDLSELKPTFLGAFTLTGEVLWQVGSGGSQPLRPGPLALYGINNDGSDEILCFFHQPRANTPKESLADVVFQIRSGKTGDILIEKAHPEIRSTTGWGPNHSPNETGMEVIHWHGEAGPDLLYNGGHLFDGTGQSRPLSDLPPPVGPAKMGWYHWIPGNFCGDTREDILVYNP